MQRICDSCEHKEFTDRSGITFQNRVRVGGLWKREEESRMRTNERVGWTMRMSYERLIEWPEAEVSNEHLEAKGERWRHRNKWRCHQQHA